MRTTVNRVLLAVVGLVLLGTGLAVLIGGLDLQRHWGFTLPSAWPFTGPHDVLLTARDRTRYRHDSWWWPVVISVLSVLFVIAVGWLLAQLRGRRVRRLRMATGDGQTATLRGRALEAVLGAEAAALPGVRRASVRLTGRSRAPRGSLRLALEPHAVPSEVVAGLDLRVLREARSSVGLAELPAEARLGAVRHRAERVE
jgi:hypothetical protein